MQLGSHLDFRGNQALNLVLEQAATAALNAGLTVMGEVGYDITLLRAKIFDGTTVRRLLQDNDISTDATLGGASPSDLIIASQKAVKTYADAILTSGQQAFVDFDASTQTQFPAGATLSSRYRVTVAGTVQGVVLQATDVFYPRVAAASPTVAGDWMFIQGNTDAASTSALGLVILATLAQLQANAGGDANKVITVATLNAWEAALGRVKKFAQTLNIAVGANAITHNLATTNVQVQAYDANGPIFFKWTNTNANTLSIAANQAFTSVTVVVQG